MANDIFVIAEHREGELRDITFEILTKAREVASTIGGSVHAVLLGHGADNLAEALKTTADKVIYVENEKLGYFNSEYYQEALSSLFKEREPLLAVFGHTSQSFDLAPSLAVASDVPIITGCSDFRVEGTKVLSTNPVYGGKINAEYSFDAASGGIVALLPGSVAVEEGGKSAEIEKIQFTFDKEFEEKQFIKFVEAAAGEIDITQAEKIVAIGRGIKEEENLKIIEEFASRIGAVVACSRPIVDAGWLPKDRQVGSSGKTVKPKLYIALGISGAFQHVTGMKASDTIIAVNKDPKAPIFTAAHYGIVDDLFKVVPALQEKVVEMRA